MAADSGYSIEVQKISHGPGVWQTIHAEVMHDGKRCGHFDYGYHSGPPWLVFERDGKHYALFADRDYTQTKVMALPSCETVAVETDKPTGFGFCPVEFADDDGTLSVYGCVWGGPYGWAPITIDFESGRVILGETVYDDEPDDDDDDDPVPTDEEK